MTTTTNHSNRTPRKFFQTLFFCFVFLLFYFDLQLKKTLFIFLVKTDGKSYRISIKTFFGLHLKLTKKRYCISLFANRTPQKIVLCPLLTSTQLWRRAAKFFFLPWFCRFITSHPLSQPCDSYSALALRLIRYIYRLFGTRVLGS